MVEQTIMSMDNAMLNPVELITLMFERTSEDGILYIPSYTQNNDYRCRVDWNLTKYELLLEKFQKHYNCIEQIAVHEDALDGTYETAKKVLGNTDLAIFWNTYLRPFDIGDIDLRKIQDIDDRKDTVELIRQIAENLAGGNELSETDQQFLIDYMNIKVTDEESRYFEKYVSAIYTDAEKRLSKKLSAYQLIIHSMRLCRLLHLNAPEVIVLNEGRAVAVSMLLNEYGISKEHIDNSYRLQIEQMELMSEDDLDELYRPKKTNNRKSMAPLFVYSILKEKSDSKHHLRQQTILRELEKYPYELTIERKALSRIIHGLTESSQYAVFQDRSGVWIAQ